MTGRLLTGWGDEPQHNGAVVTIEDRELGYRLKCGLISNAEWVARDAAALIYGERR